MNNYVEEIKTLELQINALNESMKDIISQIMSIDMQLSVFSGEPVGSCFFPVGTDLFIKGNVDGHFLYHIGNNIFIEMDRLKIISILEDKKRKLEERAKKLKNTLIKLEEKYYDLVKKMQG